MTMTTDYDAGAVGGEPVPGDHDPCLGGDVEELGTDQRDAVTVAAASSGGTE